MSIDEYKIDILKETAKKAADFAYAPYSGFCVGAALLTEEGDVFHGCNVENSTYGATVCAERSAVCTAVSAGHKRFAALAIYVKGENYAVPCGICRQVLAEFADDMPIFCFSDNKEHKYMLSELLPEAFRL